MPRIRLLAFALLFVATSAHASMQSTVGFPIKVRGHLGLGATFWTYDASEEIYKTKGFLDERFTQKASPYVMRQLELWVSLWGVEISINYLSSTLLGFAGLSSEEPPVGKIDQVAAILGGNADYIFLRGLGLHLGTAFRRFEIHQTYKGYGEGYGMYYNDAKGVSRLLAPNDGVQFFTHSSDIELGLLVGIGELLTFDFGGDEPGMPFYFGLGYKRRAYQAPMLVEIGGGLADPTGVYVNTLMNAELVSNAFWFSARYDGQADPETDPLVARVIANVSLGPPSMNSYFLNTQAGIYTELYLEFALTYAFRIADVAGSVQLGAYAAAVLTQLSQAADDTETQTTHDLPYVDVLGTSQVLPAGTTVQLSLDRAELYWGPFLNIAVQW